MSKEELQNKDEKTSPLMQVLLTLSVSFRQMLSLTIKKLKELAMLA